MGSLLKPSVVVGFLLLLPALVFGELSVVLNMFQDKNCTEGIFRNLYIELTDPPNPEPTISFRASLNESYTFESSILTNYTGAVLSLVACEAGLLCNDTGAIQIPFNLSDIGACSTAGPAGTKFDKFEISRST